MPILPEMIKNPEDPSLSTTASPTATRLWPGRRQGPQLPEAARLVQAFPSSLSNASPRTHFRREQAARDLRRARGVHHRPPIQYNRTPSNLAAKEQRSHNRLILVAKGATPHSTIRTKMRCDLRVLPKTSLAGNRGPLNSTGSRHQSRFLLRVEPPGSQESVMIPRISPSPEYVVLHDLRKRPGNRLLLGFNPSSLLSTTAPPFFTTREDPQKWQ